MIASETTEYDLTGLIDMHIHTAPDVRPRYADDIDTVRAAKEAGMAAILIKSHKTLTADRAAIAEKVVGGIRVFGGLALNDFVGGLNPAAVEVALKMDAKQIWMPTRSAAQNRKEYGMLGGIYLLTDDGKFRPEVHMILDLIHEADAILGTGHISPQESMALVRLARQKGLRKIVVTHPEAHFTWMEPEMQKEIAGKGVFFERCYVDTTPVMNSTVSIAQIAEHIRAVGVESTILSTDFGQAASPPPVEGMRAYLAKLAAEGFSPDQIQRMAGENPAHLLGL
jgi:hypothetical protein